MSKDLTDAEWLAQIRDDFAKIFSDTERERFDIIAARLEQLERENAELKGLFELQSVALANATNEQVETTTSTRIEPALGPNPTVAKIVQDYLRRNGYEGTWYDDGADFQCFCADEEFADHRTCFVCRAGYIQNDGSIGPERKDGSHDH